MLFEFSGLVTGEQDHILTVWQMLAYESQTSGKAWGTSFVKMGIFPFL